MWQLTFDGQVSCWILIPQVTHITPKSPRVVPTSRLYIPLSYSWPKSLDERSKVETLVSNPDLSEERRVFVRTTCSHFH